jgi:hypothetical protein
MINNYNSKRKRKRTRKRWGIFQAYFMEERKLVNGPFFFFFLGVFIKSKVMST